MSNDLSIGTKAIEITADIKTKAYGDADPALTYQITSGSLVGSDVFTGSLSRIAGEEVGSYAIHQGTVTAGSNYNISFVSADLTIGQRAIEVTADAKSKTYGDADPVLTYTISNGSLIGSDVLSGDLSRTAGEDVGTHAILQGNLDNSNYAITFVSNDLTINTRYITVSTDAQTKIYGELDPVFTYQISSGTLVGNDTFTGSLSRIPGEDVGTYTISQGTLELSANYYLAFVGAELTIAQRDIEITANNKTKITGTADPVLDYTISKGSLAFSDTFTGSLTRDAGESVGTYAITQGTLAASANYQLSFVPGTLTITDLQTQSITFDALADVSYGDADFTLTATGGGSGNPVTFTSSNTSVASISGNTLSIHGAGTTEITASQAGNEAYASAADVTHTLVVNSRGIEITADAQTKPCGAVDPELTYQITNGSLIGNDALSGSLTRVSGEDLGAYPN